jgi:hypothetical protein
MNRGELFFLLYGITIILFCSVFSIGVYGTGTWGPVDPTRIEPEKGKVIHLSQVLRSADASGQGTHSNFLDPKSVGEPVLAVMGNEHKTNRWVNARYSYYADGFDAELTEGGKIFAGVWTTADVSHSQAAWDGQKSGSVFDSVSANSRLYFEFMIWPESGVAPTTKTIPINIEVNILMDVSASSRDDAGHSSASIILEQDSKRIRALDIQRVAVEGKEPVTLGINVDELPPGTSGLINDDGKSVSMEFFNLLLEPNKPYRIRLFAKAGAWSAFTTKDTNSHASASTFIDPSIRFSPDFTNPDDYKILVSQGLINEGLAMEPRITLSMAQGGKELTQVDVDGGPVTFIAPTVMDQNGDTEYVWSAMDSNIYDTDGVYFDNSYTFDPSELQPGPYTMHLITFPPLDPNRGLIRFEVTSSSQTEPEQELRHEPETEPEVGPEPEPLAELELEQEPDVKQESTSGVLIYILAALVLGIIVLYLLQMRRKR